MYFRLINLYICCALNQVRNLIIQTFFTLKFLSLVDLGIFPPIFSFLSLYLGEELKQLLIFLFEKHHILCIMFFLKNNLILNF